MHSSHLPSLVSSQLDLPVTVSAASPDPPSGATMNLLTSEPTSILNTNTVRVSSKRRRSDRLEDTMPESAKIEAGNNGSKRASLMDTINKLSAGHAAGRSAEPGDRKSALDLLFGQPSIAQT